MHTILSRLTLVALIVGSPLPAAAVAHAMKAYPVDEAVKDRSLKAIRDKLLAAVRKRDVEATLSFMSPEVKLSLGDDRGHARFREMVARTPSVWTALEWALRHGGRFGGDGAWFAAPYTAEAKLGKVEPFDALIVIARGVPVRAAPASSTRVIARLSFDIVAMVEPPGRRGLIWRKVRTPGGRIGWIHKRFARSPVDHRIVFRRAGSSWIVVSFFAGD